MKKEKNKNMIWVSKVVKTINIAENNLTQEKVEPIFVDVLETVQGTYNRIKHGLIGSELLIYNDLWVDNKTPNKFKKLNSLQKKVIRKMNLDKSLFLI